MLMKLMGIVVAIAAIGYGVYNIESGTYRRMRRPVRLIGTVVIIIACIIKFFFLRD